MGPPPRSLTAEANSCFMVRVPQGPNRIQGCGASIAPERGLPSDKLYRTSNNEGHRDAVTLDMNVLIQGCVKRLSCYDSLAESAGDGWRGSLKEWIAGRRACCLSALRFGSTRIILSARSM